MNNIKIEEKGDFVMNNKYHGQFELDRFLNEEYIKDKKDGFFVEVGAHNGFNEITCLFFEEYLNWKENKKVVV